MAGYQDAVKNLTQSSLSFTNWGGKQYTLPVGVYIPLLGYNKKLLSDAGVPAPDPVTGWSLDQFFQYGPKLTKQSGGKYSQYAINLNDLDPVWTRFIYLYGGKVYDNPVNPTKITTNTPEGIQGLTAFQKLYTQHLAVPQAEQANGPWGYGDLDSLLTNKVAFARIGAFDFAQIEQQNLLSQIGACPQFTINGNQLTLGNANSFGIYKQSKYPEAAWEFVKWASSTDGDKGFAQISDVPADTTDLNSMASYITPAELVPTLQAAAKTFLPIVMTPKSQLGTDYTNIITDLTAGKITPTQAAQQIETKGNADLSAA
jgi:multiple sugar transport system substrate-binding protein